MTDRMDRDPELDFAELCMDAADRAEQMFEHWFQRADEAPSPRVRKILAKLAAEEMVFGNQMRADADDLMWDYDDGSH